MLSCIVRCSGLSFSDVSDIALSAGDDRAGEGDMLLAARGGVGEVGMGKVKKARREKKRSLL